MKKRPSFTKEFKLEAVRLLEQGDKTPADLARELGIRRNQLYKWQEQLSKIHPSLGHPTRQNERPLKQASLPPLKGIGIYTN